MGRFASRSRCGGFWVADLMFILLFILPLLIGIMLPALGAARRTARQMQNNTQLRGILQGCVIYAQGNKRGGGDGYFPGLDATGSIAPGSVAGQGRDGFTAEAGTAGNVVALLLTGDFIPAGSAEYFLNPADTEVRLIRPGDAVVAPRAGGGRGHFSYAFLDYAGVDAAGQVPGVGEASASPGRQWEWKETINTQAVVLGDRNTGADAVLGGRISSVWTDDDSGFWRGGVTRNDSSTETMTQPIAERLQYGQIRVPSDHLFVEDAFDADQNEGWFGQGRQPADDPGWQQRVESTANALLVTGPHALR